MIWSTATARRRRLRLPVYPLSRRPGAAVAALSLLVGLLATPFTAPVAAAALFVQSQQTTLLAEPRLGAEPRARAPRGAELESLSADDAWIEVRYQGVEGWVSRLTVAPQPPLPRQSVLDGDAPDLDNPRRRPSEVASAAAARGLTPEQRERLSDRRGADYAALAAVESFSFDPTALSPPEVLPFAAAAGEGEGEGEGEGLSEGVSEGEGEGSGAAAATQADAEPSAAPERPSARLTPRQARQRLNQLDRFDFSSDDVAVEIDFGREVTALLFGRYPLDDDEAVRRYVAQVGAHLAAQANRPEIDFVFAVLESEQVSAFAAPGGYIFISRGALALMADEAELAGVLGHEIVHVAERHIVEAVDIRSGETGVVSGLSRLIGSAGDPARAAFNQAVDQALEILLETGLSAADEYEADRYGAFLAAQAGYDPHGLPRFLDRVAANQAAPAGADMAATHPPFHQRTAALATFFDESGLADVDQPRLASRFLDRFHAAAQ